MINRRTFLKYGLATSLSTFCKLSLAQNPNKKVLIFIDLFGGSDGLNILVPFNDKHYYEARPNIAIQKEDTLPISQNYGVNKTLKDTYYEWFKEDNAVFFPRAGQEINSRSHFMATDILGYGVNKSTNESGFLGRLNEVLNKSQAISFTENEKPFTRSSKKIVPSIGVMQLDGKYLEFESLNKYDKFKENFEAVNSNNQILKQLDKNSLTNKKTNLGKISQYINNSQTNIIFYEINGWDTHSNQNTRLKNKLSELNKELSELKTGLGDNWKNTAIIVMSEFGRTVKDNGDGTDHGFGNLISIFGGLIKHSKIIGGEKLLSSENIHEDRELNVEYSYRDILRELFKEMYSLNEEQLNYIFPNSNNLDYKILS